MKSTDTPKPRLTTPWTELAESGRVETPYPRPHRVRDGWICLNGDWDYAVLPGHSGPPNRWDGKIRVPFPIESYLSGVQRAVSPSETLWYRNEIDVPQLPDGHRLLLHFEAVDWCAEVAVNGQPAGRHRGGFDPFCCDLTPFVEGESGTKTLELTVAVTDPTDTGSQPRGKQTLEPKGIWYTAVTGIWQTVWLEVVPACSIRDLDIQVDAFEGLVQLRAELDGSGAASIRWSCPTEDGSFHTNSEPYCTAEIRIETPRRWSPDDPHLYPLEVELLDADGLVLDRVTSYFALRSVSVGKGPSGLPCMLLNGEPIFPFGPLDQGWWPDGLLTPPCDDALLYDIVTTRRLGFNLIRKHVKVEPARFYHHCDRLGILVWQDIPNGHAPGETIRPEALSDVERSPEAQAQFEAELSAIIRSRRHFPCIVTWVPYNEGWGQCLTEHVTSLVRALDPTRLCNSTSGWTDRGVGDFLDVHRYPGPLMEVGDGSRIPVLGEFGGLGLPIPGRLWQQENNWGYRGYSELTEFRDAYSALLTQLEPLIRSGLAAAVYTQTTDVEGEVNGLLTYDRQELKLDQDSACRRHTALIRAFQDGPDV